MVIGSELENISHLNVIRNDNFDPLNNDLDGNILVVFDDIIFNKQQMKLAGETFIRGRHKKVSSLFLTQNIFLSDQNYRIISLNATHAVIFRVRDLRQIQLFGKTFLQDSSIHSFIATYKKNVINGDFGYILVDFTKNFDSPLMIRTNILGEGYEKAIEL